MTTGWVYLFAGTIGEVIWIMSLRSTEGFSRFWPTVFNLGIAGANIWLLSFAFRVLPTSAAYAVWVGASTIGVAVCSMYFQGEQMTLSKVFFIALIIGAVIGLKTVSQS